MEKIMLEFKKLDAPPKSIIVLSLLIITSWQIPFIFGAAVFGILSFDDFKKTFLISLRLFYLLLLRRPHILFTGILWVFLFLIIKMIHHIKKRLNP
ncbi:hypothetical protein [Treponema pedis]|uniref:hypothetical protein n=1 Tax=Treponema pedis TaxID=409322 RepID=UPI00197D3EE9|nr:hypothetical protein [Treponema pedis]QSI03888.1 hypothetical protein DYQ05_02590 [Treponema pedis]